MSSITQHTTRRLSHCYWRFELRAHRALCLESRVLSGARDDVGSLDSLAGGCAGVGFDSRVDAKTRQPASNPTYWQEEAPGAFLRSLYTSSELHYSSNV
ncbi:hypothetical protein SFRURICE_021194 [Spodoptera frugiperda]|nr:hypothetical protein SFRURICE_021194 [Spodoptera frugiperda]